MAKTNSLTKDEHKVLVEYLEDKESMDFFDVVIDFMVLGDEYRVIASKLLEENGYEVM